MQLKSTGFFALGCQAIVWGRGSEASGINGITGDKDDSPSSCADVQPLRTRIWPACGDGHHGCDLRVGSWFAAWLGGDFGISTRLY